MGELFVAGRATAVGGADNFYIRYNEIWPASISESFVATYCDVTVGIEKAAIQALTPATTFLLPQVSDSVLFVLYGSQNQIQKAGKTSRRPRCRKYRLRRATECRGTPTAMLLAPSCELSTITPAKLLYLPFLHPIVHKY